MAGEKPQQQTLSVRIGDALRRRLEAIRQQAATKTGQFVSTSEIAKQLLESARDDRIEFVNLLAEPTDSLRAVRSKAEAGLPLSRAEWSLVAHFVQQGLEAFNDFIPSRVSRTALIAALDAFAAVYELRLESDTAREPYYLGNMPAECRPASTSAVASRKGATSKVVRQTVAATRARLEDPTWPQTPFLIGRNLYVLLEDENLQGPDALSRALMPFWLPLWRVAARGHFAHTGRAVHPSTARASAWADPPIPPLSDADLSLAFMRLEGGDLSVLITFPGTFGAMYPVNGYPKLAEFRAMLDALGPDRQRQWNGARFFGYVTVAPKSEESGVWFRAPENGISVGLSLQRWASLRALFQQAWETHDVRRAWDALAIDYGEL